MRMRTVILMGCLISFAPVDTDDEDENVVEAIVCEPSRQEQQSSLKWPFCFIGRIRRHSGSHDLQSGCPPP